MINGIFGLRHAGQSWLSQALYTLVAAAVWIVWIVGVKILLRGRLERMKRIGDDDRNGDGHGGSSGGREGVRMEAFRVGGDDEVDDDEDYEDREGFGRGGERERLRGGGKTSNFRD